MRLLYYNDTGAIRLTEDIVTNIPPYAILSHTWDAEEVTLQELNDGAGPSKRGYHKIRFCGEQARRNDLSYFWVDTCCIDKDNAAELQEAINSMCRWYRNAARCYVYLIDVSCPTNQFAEPPNGPWQAAFRKSRWFTRGWTLQELLAPASVEFFSREGALLGDKSSLERSINDVTRIPVQALRNSRLSDFCASERFSWMDSRKTTLEEDMAYALLGIFDVQMPLLYGEGRVKAYGRLQKEIEKQQECLQLFRLTNNNRDATYEWYKDRVEDRVRDTCQWFLQHANFQRWLEQESGPLLVSADPGCGKSVLAKYLIDYHLIDHHLPRSATICYFFFKDQDQNTARQALCALLHQLLSQKPSLIKHARKQFEENGRGLINSNNLLWTILRNSVQDPHAGSVIIVLDALDECAESEFEDLVRNVQSQLRSNQRGKLKYLLTSRPYEQIVSKFHGLLATFPYIRIPGEEQSETISQEVNCVIKYRVEKLAGEKKFSNEIKHHLAQKLLEIPHRTYLWVYLVFDYLSKANFKKTPNGIETIIATLPESVSEAYERILSKSEDHPMVRKALSIMLAASRPLTLSEMNIAVNIDEDSRSVYDLDLEKEEDFKSRLRSCCGLFVSIHLGKIYFLHQTARQFLLAELSPPATVPSALHWHHSITIRHAHTVLVELCVRYLNLFNSDANLLLNANVEAGCCIDTHAFLDYSARNWATHFCEARISSDDAATMLLASEICDRDSKAYSAWFKICLDACCQTPLSLMAANGHEAVVRLLLDKGAAIVSKDRDGLAPLSLAAMNGHGAVVRLLLERGAEVDAIEQPQGALIGRTALALAAKNGHEEVVRLLLEHGAGINVIQRCEWGWNVGQYGEKTAMMLAVEEGHEGVVRLLLEKRADINLKQQRQWPDWVGSNRHYDEITALTLAATRGHEEMVRLLLENAADVNAVQRRQFRDYMTANWHYEEMTALTLATKEGHEGVVRLLLEYGADVNTRGWYGSGSDDYGFHNRDEGTALTWAAEKGFVGVVRLILAKRADIEAIRQHRWGDHEGYIHDDAETALVLAAENGHEVVTQLLLESGANVNAIRRRHRRNWFDPDGDNYQVELTALTWAARKGCGAVVRLLLKNGADINVLQRCRKHLGGRGWHPQKDMTALSLAAYEGQEKVVRLLLESGIDIETKDEDGRTPLSRAAWNWNKAVVQLLVDKGAFIESKDKDGRTPLSWAAGAAWNWDKAVVQLLVDKGAFIESKDKDGRTPLSWAAGAGYEAVVQLLVDKGAFIESEDKDGRTPLSWAAGNGNVAVVRLLLDEGADLLSRDKTGKTPYLHATDASMRYSRGERGCEAVIRLLQMHSRDIRGERRRVRR